MFEKRHSKLLKDAFEFKELVGGAIALCEAGWDPRNAMDDDYMEEIEELLREWLPDVYENMSILKIDDCLEAERELNEFFKREILEIMNN